MADKTLTEVRIPPIISVGQFAERIGLTAAQVITELMKNGVMATINEDIDFETASIIGEDLGFKVVPEKEEVKEEVPSVTAEGEQKTRPPIVAVMGHVDHGKTSLLDAIRETSVVAKEAGGITQHIGAYQVEKNGRKITFLDTPGHEAFRAMRAHGAHLTDVVVVVVAADDGVKPQTREAIKLAREEHCAIVVAVNKVDAEGADPERVRSQLVEEGLVPEGWGGTTVTVDVSAKTKQGIPELLEMVLLVSDIEELTARYEGPAEGIVVEAHQAPGKGPVATVLIGGGVLRVGDCVAIGEVTGRIRTMEDSSGRRLKEANPATPVQISGLKAVPEIGERLAVYASDKEAKAAASGVQRERSAKRYADVKKIGVSELTAAVKAGEVSELPVVLKADVQGSLEAVRESLADLSHPEVGVKVASEGVGDVTETDVNQAAAGGAIILGFNVAVPPAVASLAKQKGIAISVYRVIYELVDAVREALEAMLPPEEVRTEVARLEVRGVFRRTKGQVIAGGLVSSGTLERGLLALVLRGEEKIGEGRIVSLKREAENVKEVASGVEGGFAMEPGVDIQVGDVLVAYRVEERKRTL